MKGHNEQEEKNVEAAEGEEAEKGERLDSEIEYLDNLLDRQRPYGWGNRFADTIHDTIHDTIDVTNNDTSYDDE